MARTLLQAERVPAPTALLFAVLCNLKDLPPVFSVNRMLWQFHMFLQGSQNRAAASEEQTDALIEWVNLLNGLVYKIGNYLQVLFA